MNRSRLRPSLLALAAPLLAQEVDGRVLERTPSRHLLNPIPVEIRNGLASDRTMGR